MSSADGALVVTTTGLGREARERVRAAAERAGGRYSPNLSRRCTHLVVAAAAGGAGGAADCATAAAAPSAKLETARALQARWRLKIVDADAFLRCGGGGGGGGSSGGGGGGSSGGGDDIARGVAVDRGTPGACGGSGGCGDPAADCGSPPAWQQAPWRVHFSQLPADSVYAPPPPPPPAAAPLAAAHSDDRPLDARWSPAAPAVASPLAFEGALPAAKDLSSLLAGLAALRADGDRPAVEPGPAPASAVAAAMGPMSPAAGAEDRAPGGRSLEGLVAALREAAGQSRAATAGIAPAAHSQQRELWQQREEEEQQRRRQQQQRQHQQQQEREQQPWPPIEAAGASSWGFNFQRLTGEHQAEPKTWPAAHVSCSPECGGAPAPAAAVAAAAAAATPSCVELTFAPLSATQASSTARGGTAAVTASPEARSAPPPPPPPPAPPPLAGAVALLDPALPAARRAELATAVEAAGGRVAAGSHLGGGASLVVCEPHRARAFLHVRVPCCPECSLSFFQAALRLAATHPTLNRAHQTSSQPPR